MTSQRDSVKVPSTKMPKGLPDWLHLLFCACETLALSMTGRDMITRSDNISDSLSGIHFLSDEYYFVYFFALFLLAVASFFIRHYYPGLSAVGWLTVGVMVVRLVVVLPVF